MNGKIQEFERNSILLFVLMMSANACNYLFQIVMGKMMAIEQYAQVNTVVSLVGVLAIPSTIITLISARYIALNAAMDWQCQPLGVFRFLLKFTLSVVLILIIVIGVLINKITWLFTLDSKYYLVGALLITIFNLFYSVISGMLQGMKRFFQYGMQSILSAAGKLIFSVGLVLMGWEIYGVIAAILIGTGIAILYGICYMNKYLFPKDVPVKKYKINIKEFIQYSLGTIVAQGCVIALTNGDILLVKVFFSDVETGLYSSASVIGKIAMYVSTAVVTTLFPMVVEKNQKGECTDGLFRKAMLYGGGIAVMCAVGMILLGNFIIGLLFGERYLQALDMLPAVCVYVVPLTFITIMMNYLLAINKIKFFGKIMIITLIVIVGISGWFHNSVSALMIMAGCVLWIAFLVNVISLYGINNRPNVKKE